MDMRRLSVRWRRWSAQAARLMVLFVLSAGVSRAQNVFDSVRTANGYCHTWHAPPGFSNPSDLSYSRCAVDRPARRLSGPDIPAPTIGLYAGGSIFIVVRADGTVDSALTRTSTITSDTSFDNHVLATVRQWRFEPALRNRVPVRAGSYLEFTSTTRDDTVPAHLEWRYVQGRDGDSAVARWVVDTTRPPPLTQPEADSVYAAVFRELVRLQVLLPNRRYCLVPSTDDTLAARRLDSIARNTFRRGGPVMTTTVGCERDPRFFRLVMPSVFRTERDRVVLFPRGDFLPVWPWGLDAKSWRAWTGRCVGRVLASGRAAMSCGVQPTSMDEAMADRTTVPSASNARPWVEGDSVRFTVLATRAGAYLVDTLHYATGQLPILDQHAVVDSLVACGNRAAYTTQSDSVFIVHGAVGSTTLDIDPVHPSSRPPRRGGSATCPRRPSSAGPFAAFFLGGIGTRPTAPVHLCFSNCAYGYDVDPQRHMLAIGPVAVVRDSALRPETHAGKADVMRILMDHGPPDVGVFVAYRTGVRWPGFGLIPLHPTERRWDFAIGLDDGEPDYEFWVYMFRRSHTAIRSR